MAGLGDPQLPAPVNAAMNPGSGGPLAQAAPAQGGPPPGGGMSPMQSPPSWAGTQAPMGSMGGTMMPQEMMLKMMGALDDPEARRHKFIGSLLQGTHSGSTGESFGNAYSALGDYELEQMRLRSAYAPMMMREFTMMNQAQQAQYKMMEESRKNWEGHVQTAVSSLDPRYSNDLDVASTVNNLVRQGLIPQEYAHEYINNWNSRLKEGVSTGELLNEVSLQGAPGEKRVDINHPQSSGVAVPGGSAQVTPSRVGIGPPSQVGATIKGLPEVQRVSGEGGPDYYVFPSFGGHRGLKVAATDPRLSDLMAEYQHQGAFVAQTTPAPAPLPPPGTQPPPAPGGPPPQPGTGGAGGAAPAAGVQPPIQTPAPAGIQPPGAPLGGAPVPAHPPVAPIAPGAALPGAAAPLQDAAAAHKAEVFSDAPPKEAFTGPPAPGAGKNAFDLAKTNAENFVKRYSAASSDVTGEQSAVADIRRALMASQQFQPGKATPALADMALWFKSVAPHFGMDPGTADNLSRSLVGGDPGAVQYAAKLSLTQALTQLRAQLQNPDSGGMAGRETQAEILKMLNNVINSGMDPGAIGRLYQAANQHYEISQAELRAMSKWRSAAGPNMDQVDFSKFTPWWQGKLDQRGWKGYQLSPGTPGDKGAPPLSWEWRINPQNNQIEATDQRDQGGQPINWRIARPKTQKGAQP